MSDVLQEWIMCPICNNKTRLKVRIDTVLENFPLFCPKCKQETIISVKPMNITIIKEPDAQMQSQQPAKMKLLVVGSYFTNINTTRLPHDGKRKKVVWQSFVFMS